MRHGFNRLQGDWGCRVERLVILWHAGGLLLCWGDSRAFSGSTMRSRRSKGLETYADMVSAWRGFYRIVLVRVGLEIDLCRNLVGQRDDVLAPLGACTHDVTHVYARSLSTGVSLNPVQGVLRELAPETLLQGACHCSEDHREVIPIESQNRHTEVTLMCNPSRASDVCWQCLEVSFVGQCGGSGGRVF